MQGDLKKSILLKTIQIIVRDVIKTFFQGFKILTATQ